MQLKEVIRQYLDEHGMPAREFGRKCGFSNSYVSILLSGVNPRTKEELRPTMDTYQKVAKGMGISLEDLLSRVGYTSKWIISEEDDKDYNPFYDMENDAYGTDIEWRKMHGAIDDRPRLTEIVRLCRDMSDDILDKIIVIIKTLKG